MPKWLLKLFGFLTGSKATKVVKTAGDIVREAEEEEAERFLKSQPPPTKRSRFQ